MTATATYPGSPVRVDAINGEREAVIRGLVSLAAFLTDHPEAPVRRFGHDILFSPLDGVTGVRRLAAELGIKAVESGHSVRATIRFGPVAYVLYAAKGQEER